jgi:hypothetical protein
MVATLGAIQPSQPQTSTWGGQLPPAAAPTNLGAPTVAGDARKGVVLRGHAGSWAGSTDIADQWQRCTNAADPTTCLNIPGAGSTAYTSSTADVGNYLRLVDTANNDGATATAASTMTGAITDPTAVPAPAAASAAPGAKETNSQACAASNRVRLRLTVPRRLRLRTVVVVINGHRSATVRGNRRRLTVSLPELPRAEKVQIRARTTAGQPLRATRTFKGCTVTQGRMRLR